MKNALSTKKLTIDLGYPLSSFLFKRDFKEFEADFSSDELFSELRNLKSEIVLDEISESIKSLDMEWIRNVMGEFYATMVEESKLFNVFVNLKKSGLIMMRFADEIFYNEFLSRHKELAKTFTIEVEDQYYVYFESDQIVSNVVKALRSSEVALFDVFVDGSFPFLGSVICFGSDDHGMTKPKDWKFYHEVLRRKDQKTLKNLNFIRYFERHGNKLVKFDVDALEEMEEFFVCDDDLAFKLAKRWIVSNGNVDSMIDSFKKEGCRDERIEEARTNMFKFIHGESENDVVATAHRREPFLIGEHYDRKFYFEPFLIGEHNDREFYFDPIACSWICRRKFKSGKIYEKTIAASWELKYCLKDVCDDRSNILFYFDKATDDPNDFRRKSEIYDHAEWNLLKAVLRNLAAEKFRFRKFFPNVPYLKIKSLIGWHDGKFFGEPEAFFCPLDDSKNRKELFKKKICKGVLEIQFDDLFKKFIDDVSEDKLAVCACLIGFSSMFVFDDDVKAKFMSLSDPVLKRVSTEGAFAFLNGSCKTKIAEMTSKLWGLGDATFMPESSTEKTIINAMNQFPNMPIFLGSLKDYKILRKICFCLKIGKGWAISNGKIARNVVFGSEESSVFRKLVKENPDLKPNLIRFPIDPSEDADFSSRISSLVDHRREGLYQTFAHKTSKLIMNDDFLKEAKIAFQIVQDHLKEKNINEDMAHSFWIFLFSHASFATMMNDLGHENKVFLRNSIQSLLDVIDGVFELNEEDDGEFFEDEFKKFCFSLVRCAENRSRCLTIPDGKRNEASGPPDGTVPRFELYLKSDGRTADKCLFRTNDFFEFCRDENIDPKKISLYQMVKRGFFSRTTTSGGQKAWRAFYEKISEFSNYKHGSERDQEKT